MPLSEQDKQRIREEEAYRLQVQDDLRRHSPRAVLKAVIFWIVLVSVTILLFVIVHNSK